MDLINGLFWGQLLRFMSYYLIRDRVTFYTLLLYLWNPRGRLRYIPLLFLVLAIDIGLVSLYLMLSGMPNDFLTGFIWRYAAPLQYSAQIVALSVFGWTATKSHAYTVALAYHGAAATGYVYEIPFWLFSVSPSSHLLHVSHKYTFFFDYQMIAIGVFVWLLFKRGVRLDLRDAALFAGAVAITVLMASKMYVWETAPVARLPMIAYSLWLGVKTI